MKINISSKNYPMSEKLSNYIEKKLDKIGKYFDEDTTANIVVSKLRETPKFEATINAKQAVLRISVHEDLIDYAASLVEFTRTSGDVLCGASPRAFLDLLQTARALAYLTGRDFCTPEDIRNNAKRVLAHRLIIHSDAMMRSVTGEKIIERALYEVPMPE